MMQLRNADCGLRNENITSTTERTLFNNPQSAIRNPKFLRWPLQIVAASIFLFILITSPCFADETLSGSLNLRGVDRLEKDSLLEDPSFTGRLKLESGDSSWRFHSWLEGGWDGTVKRPPRDRGLFKNYDEVYQSDSPYLEFKELYVTHTSGPLDLRLGIQRFAWGRLDEYPPNDLLNPWDYTQFLVKPLEDRKIGVPSLSATLSESDWTLDAVWIPVFIPYRLPLPDERWQGASIASAFQQTIPNAIIVPQEPDLPDHRIENSSVGLRMKHSGDIEWALDLFHGYDPRPVFRTTALSIIPQGGKVLIDPGYVPDFHKIDVVGMDAATVRGDLSIRIEAAFTWNRYLNIDRTLWGYPTVPMPGIKPLNPIEEKHDTVDYGIGADYRLFEDAQLTVQAQQTLILGNTDRLYEKNAETLLWANVKIGWMNQKIETNVNFAYNPEHGGTMGKADATYVFSDSWKMVVTAINLDGPPESLFGRYARNDQVEGELVYLW